MATHDLERLVSRLELATERLEKMGLGSSSKANGKSDAVDQSSNAPSVIAYDALLNGDLKAFLDNSAKIHTDLKAISDMVKKLFDLQRNLIVETTKSTKPTNDAFMKALEPMSKQIQEIQQFREKNRKSEFFNHFSAISEAIGALGWLTVEPAPCPYIKEMSDAGQFYTNRVLKDYKEKDKIHQVWVTNWLQLLTGLQAYVKQYHTTGLAWNPKGGKFDGTSSHASKPAIPPKPVAASAKTSPAPPPPPPPMPMFDYSDDANQKKGESASDIQARLKQELSVGMDITKSLKKVSDDQKTHKNPALRAGSTVPATSSSATAAASSAQSRPSNSASTKPPKLELNDKKWCVEYFANKNDLVVSDTEIKQTVYIFQCKNCTIKVQGKVNSISLDSCERVALLFDDVLSTVEFINSKSVQAQVTGKVPTISIDKTDGCQFYLSKKSLDAEIVTAKSSAVNILVPDKQGDEYTEYPLPEQFKTVFTNQKPVTTPIESA